MPNGGPDNCGTRGFNRRNRGLWRNSAPHEQQLPFCEIRSVAVLIDHWTYCQNWHTRTRKPIGPIYASGLYEGVTGGFPGTVRLSRNPQARASAPNAAKPLGMESPSLALRAQHGSSAATCTICSGGSASIPEKTRR